jgi:hypothetical protein
LKRRASLERKRKFYISTLIDASQARLSQNSKVEPVQVINCLIVLDITKLIIADIKVAPLLSLLK